MTKNVQQTLHRITSVTPFVFSQLVQKGAIMPVYHRIIRMVCIFEFIHVCPSQCNRHVLLRFFYTLTFHKIFRKDIMLSRSMKVIAVHIDSNTSQIFERQFFPTTPIVLLHQDRAYQEVWLRMKFDTLGFIKNILRSNLIRQSMSSIIIFQIILLMIRSLILLKFPSMCTPQLIVFLHKTLKGIDKPLLQFTFLQSTIRRKVAKSLYIFPIT